MAAVRVANHSKIVESANTAVNPATQRVKHATGSSSAFAQKGLSNGHHFKNGNATSVQIARIVRPPSAHLPSLDIAPGPPFIPLRDNDCRPRTT
jgi:hypothetical protein